MAIYAIGDIQGCYRSLRALLEQLRYSPQRDELWFTGDLVNRGPDSLATLRFVRDLGERATVVLGNHDLHLLAVWSGHARLKRGDSLSQVLDAPDCDELMHWLRGRPLLHHDAELGAVLTHAGLLPAWDLATASACATEVEQVLRGEAFPTLMAKLYGNEPDQWSEDLTGHERQRLIVNAFTRMRYCDAHGRLALRHKGAPGSQPEGLMPWFEAPGRAHRREDGTIVFGHWSTLGYVDRPGILALDTGCLWGGQLTAVRLDGPQRERHSLPCEAAMRPQAG
ncbi:symmetrical bis(5'-nucleosyl)-tetraphosphatase [Alkalilimnicola sp. S0819]|uniref:symmetrical bis(5'-nucleosyl)-tetraphosphatase n=1 Tax=Alkalilimnicola sp. S0819 TaxID=2613922 RepID=UPI0012625F52|nr:symmetrical bis(5'-nucleosyl)-tetraphosphatase [Alkalilimnicola sp. S0819]KAB7628222.1 symmetrical bis(5'-nucleosyl)-tetraphosphatase [Alkalilimnicola sp. S0819]MPQ15113.1 symmetrical bis(5'-nucleosyl)-tetraphosphatase [Alkalilimnicola sp. S0819]